MPITIVRGTDKRFVLKLRRPNGDPYIRLPEADKITLEFPKQSGKVVIDDSTIAAETAECLYEEVTFSAVVAGAAGNDIVLEFDGIKTITAVLNEWNTANPTNTAESDAADESVILTSSQVTLAGGIDSYKKVEGTEPLAVGFVQVILPDTDTEYMRLGLKQDIRGYVDFGTHPAGFRDPVLVESELNVID